jgi:hypothetical protein
LTQRTEECLELVRRWLAGEVESSELKPDRDDCAVFRVLADRKPVILKLWSKPGWRGRARRWSRTSPMRRELRALERLGAAGLAVPRVVGACGLGRMRSRWTEALVLSDLGDCTLAMVHTKMLARSGRERELHQYLTEVLDLTEGMIRCGIVDSDHSLQNLVATPDGRAVRLDFELARVAPLGIIGKRQLGVALAHLIGSYAYAIQPDVHRATEFARQLQERLRPPPAVLAAISAEVRWMMRRQLDAKGIDTRVPLPWE